MISSKRKIEQIERVIHGVSSLHDARIDLIRCFLILEKRRMIEVIFKASHFTLEALLLHNCHEVLVALALEGRHDQDSFQFRIVLSNEA